MNDPRFWHTLCEQKRETWGAFVLHALKHGCEVVRIPAEFPEEGGLTHGELMIRRFDAEVERAVRLPLLCTPDRIMRWRRFERECQQLSIPVDPTWPIAF